MTRDGHDGIWAGGITPIHALRLWMQRRWQACARRLLAMVRIRCRLVFLGSVVVLSVPLTCHADSISDRRRVQENASDHHHSAQQWLHALAAVQGSWQAVQTLTWFGRALWLRQFSLSQNLDDAATQFTQASPALDRILTGPDMLLLSGTLGNLHLVLQLQDVASGVSGFASVLDLSPSEQVATPVPQAALAELPAQTQVHTSQWQLADGTWVRQVVHVVPERPDQLRTRLHAALTRQGWQEVQALAGAPGTQWQRRGDQLHLMAHQQGQGSVLYQILQE